ncbi:hypothetical protein [Pseudogemmobacter humi]|uniref:Uncharacterized protein n=1 Tax=Pseudogemmobacter humi TaxID=2483812 RepID=A0A3P5X6J3_9RHOB|nr:hypothetical protein [Pseudogemmobacter humi]VDC22924.1 hypothetical protein XINFAN_00866 [Pseudogemmobacter humi]
MKTGTMRPGRHLLYAAVAFGLLALPAQAEWTYGLHPVLGLSAHIDLGDGNAIGLACNRREYNPMYDAFVSLRVTNGLLHEGMFLVVFDPPSGIRQFSQIERPRQTAGYTEWPGNSCETYVTEIQQSGELVTAPVIFRSFGDTDDGSFIEYEYGGATLRAFGDDGYRALPEARRISLRGSSNAIRQLIAACPSIRLDIENNCGI